MKSKTYLIGVLALVLACCVSFALGESKEVNKRDELKAAAQKICPVSGKELGSMGAPVKVKVGDEEIFLCCQSCVKGKVDKQHWVTIHKNFAKAQGKCPVMEADLPESPKWIVVKGQIIYICCPPCSKEISEAPDTYLEKIDTYYQASTAGGKKR